MKTTKQKVKAVDIKIALAQKKHSNDYFLTEVKSGPTQTNDRRNLRILDALAIAKSWAHPCLSGYEIKTSRSDFTGDAKYHTYLPLVHELSIVCPVGLIKKEELPLEVGLIWYNPETGSLTTKKKPIYRKIEISADMLMYVIMSRLEKDRIPFYSKQAEYFKDWLDNKIENRNLGYVVKSKLAITVSDLASKLDAARDFKDSTEKERYDSIIKVMQDNGYWIRQEPAEWLKKKFEEEYPEVLDYVSDSLRREVNRIERTKAKMKGVDQEDEH